MSPPAPPDVTVRTNGTQRTFAPGHDVVIGRDLRADVRIAHPLVSRAHVILRFERGRWVAVDNGSLNGMFIDHRRVSVVEIHDGQTIAIGNPDGPRLTFELGHHTGWAGRPPQATGAWEAPPSGPSYGPRHGYPESTPPPRAPSGPPPGARSPAAPPSAQQPTSQTDFQAPVTPPSTPQPTHSQTDFQAPAPPPSTPQPTSSETDFEAPTQMREPALAGVDPESLTTSVMRILRRGPSERPSGSITIGRATDNDIVIPDVLASRHHATLVPTEQGTEIRDENSINGTFVNGSRVDSALLTDGDVVTIGNVDLTFADGTLVRRSETEAATRTGGLEVRKVGLTLEHGPTLLEGISFAARPGSLTAVIGPSGAGKSTLAKMIVGTTQPTTGNVTFEGHNIHAEYASLRSRIGMVPQDDVVHRQLTVNQALGYAAELRLPPDTTKEDRQQVIAQVLEELELTQHADKRIDKLSGGQRKRASVAIELLTGPSLLVLDEPTSGLDPALDRQVMTMLRELADAGRVVVVVTHSLTYLDVCDQVLLLAPGGKTAFCGPPSDIGRAMGTTNWADIFTKVGADPDAVHRRFLERAEPPPEPAPTDKPSDLGKPVHTSLRRQYYTIARRQVRLIIADRGYFAFLAVLPFILGVLSLAVPGTVGFGIPEPMSNAPNEPGQILVLLNVGAIFMGTALTIRDLIGERPIFRREQAVGLSTTAYILAKIAVYCTAAIVQSAILVVIVILGKGAPTQGAVVLGNSSLELFVDIAGTCVAAAILGLALSAVARTADQIMPLLVVSIMSQLVFSGGMIPVTDRLVLDQMSWFTPARWGFAASASTVDLIKLVPGPLTPKDAFWEHTPHAWIFDMAMLAALCIGYAALVRWKIRLKS